MAGDGFSPAIYRDPRQWRPMKFSREIIVLLSCTDRGFRPLHNQEFQGSHDHCKITPQRLVGGRRLCYVRAAAAASGEERVRAHRGNEPVAESACDPQRHAIRPPEAGLDRILTTTPAAIDVADREFLEHLERHADMCIGQTGD